MNKKEIRFWVRHFLKRFGKENIKIYLNQRYYLCPCEALRWDCLNCIYRRQPTDHFFVLCNHSLAYNKLSREDTSKIRQKLRKKIRGVLR